jgi:HK97 family phage major capsid protein
MNLFEMKQQRAHAITKADGIIALAENAKRELTTSEQADVDMCMTTAQNLSPQIKGIESKNTITRMLTPAGMMLADKGGPGKPGTFGWQGARTLSTDYVDGFFSYVASNGHNVGAALYEGSDGAGGYAVPAVVSDQIVPLAPNELAVRRLANVVPTTSDIKVPIKATFGAAHPKAENAAFVETDPTIGQFTLSAFMNGAMTTVSWELAQDVPAFQQFAITGMLLSTQILEEGYYVAGTGIGQPQGLLGNVGEGVSEEPDASGNLVSINGTLDILGKLNAVYHPGASWLMDRATGVILRKAQTQANLFNPAWTRVGAQDFLHGYPVEYSASMPTAARGVCPILFGDFKQGYVIGDRGGSGINVKILDQPLATTGQIIMLSYRRTDGRVRRSEAIQSYNIAAS